MNCYKKDYPRPQLVRENWLNLNGNWNFAFDDANVGISENWVKSFPKNVTQEIIVPFTYETKMSGIGKEEPHSVIWYSRELVVGENELKNNKLILHFEGSDFETTLWVNGTHIGSHKGGYARFSFDITQAVTKGENTIVVRVQDSMDDRQPRGKQRWVLENFGCWYVQTTGIWKTVWAEYVPETNIKSFKMTPDYQNSAMHFSCEVNSVSYGEELQLEVTISYKDTFINRLCTAVTENVATGSVALATNSEPWRVYPWWPTEPNLYDVTIRVLKNGTESDRVGSYFGLREIRIDGRNILLNGQPLYQRLILDQGYWEHSHLTPPSEEALIEDIDKIKQLGYNGLRKHQKTEDERFLYWCDVKGMLVWSEMASTYRFDDVSVTHFMNEWGEIVRQNYNHPSIITWTPINESWGVPMIKTSKAQQEFSKAVYSFTKAMDTMRPVIVNDGWEHTVSDIITLHDYEEKGSVLLKRYTDGKEEMLNNMAYHNNNRSVFADGYKDEGQPIIISEFGGIAYNNDDNGWGYGNKVNNEEDFIARFDEITTAIKELPYCCGYCYTQVTDVQQEINGLMDINRNFKADAKRINEINMRSVSCMHIQDRK